MSVDYDVVDAIAGLAEDMRDNGRFVDRIHDTVKTLKEERDSLRAEVERLKESVANLDALYVSRTDALRESEVEVERLREVVRQVHTLVDGVTMIALPEAVRMLADIHKITKGVVE